MPNNKAAKLWFVNVVSFVLFSILTITGLTNWLFLPRGYKAVGGFLISLRHFLRQVHEWTAVLFILVVVVHLVLHWTYIKSNLKKTWNSKMKTYFSICFVVVTILFTSAICLAGEEKNHICFKVVDADQNGKVTFQEFKQFFDTDKEKFSAIDLNGDGNLSHDEYHQSLGHGAK